MTNTSPIPVRLDSQTISRLDAAAKRIGSTRAAVMRLLVEQWLEHYESEGVAVLPVDWKAIVKNLDGRTTRYSKPKSAAKISIVAEEEPGEYKTKPQSPATKKSPSHQKPPNRTKKNREK